MQRPCLDCGIPFDAKSRNVHRCPTCERKHNAKRNASPERRALYGGGWAAESRAIRAAEPWCHSQDVGLGGCPVVGVSMLTVDHPTRKPLCRHHHGRLEASRQRFIAVQQRGERVAL